MKKWSFSGALALVAWVLFGHGSSAAPHAPPVGPAQVTRPEAKAQEAQSASLTVLAPPVREAVPELPRSLEGSDLPPLTIDGHGQVTIDLRLRHLFDYFLTAQGELSRDSLVALMRSALEKRAREPSLSAALTVLDDYLALRAAEQRALSAGRPSSPDELTQAIAQRRALRRRYLAPDVVRAFFGEDEQREEYARARAAAFAQGLDPQAIERTTASLLSREERARREQTWVLERLNREEQGGEAPGTLADLSAFDEGASERLAELRVRQREFAERRAAFRELMRSHPQASERELRELARGLGLSERDYARIQAFAVQP
jgi:lipase chaperone LimK